MGVAASSLTGRACRGAWGGDPGCSGAMGGDAGASAVVAVSGPVCVYGGAEAAGAACGFPVPGTGGLSAPQLQRNPQQLHRLRQIYTYSYMT